MVDVLTDLSRRHEARSRRYVELVLGAIATASLADAIDLVNDVYQPPRGWCGSRPGSSLSSRSWLCSSCTECGASTSTGPRDELSGAAVDYLTGPTPTRREE